MPSPRRSPVLLSVLAIILVAGCAGRSSSGRGPADVADTYDGPVALAVAPVLDRRIPSSPGVPTSWIQTAIVDRLERTRGFAGVIALDRPDDEHEGEYLLEPSLVAVGGTSAPRVGIRARLTHAPTGQVRWDRIYPDTCQRCGTAPGQAISAPGLAEVTAALSSDVLRVTR
jgi:hypothetical protein